MRKPGRSYLRRKKISGPAVRKPRRLCSPPVRIKINHLRKHSEDEIRRGKEGNHERGRADELLQFEKVEHRHSEEESGKTRDQLRDVSFKLLLSDMARAARFRCTH